MPRLTIPPSMMLVLFAAASTAAQDVTTSPEDTAATTRPALLDVGAPAPPLRAQTWLNGQAVSVEQRGATLVFVVTFWASWSEPSRASLEGLSELHEEYRQRGVTFIGVTEEAPEEVRTFLSEFTPRVPFRIAIDERGVAQKAYCEAAGADFVPYSFVIAPDRTIAWHGHPQQAELVLIVEQLLTGRYDRAQARELVRKARSIKQLEALFRGAYAEESWRTALLALDGLLKAGVPKQRLLRYKLSILLGELGDLEQARALAAELTRQFSQDARFLNTLAWDLVSDPHLYLRDPEIVLRLARAAYQASGGQDAAAADTYARALHMIGRLDLAIDLQQQAIALSSPEQRPQHERMLAFYRQCQTLQATAAPGPE